MRHFILAHAISRSMADRAVIRDSREPNGFFRKTDWNLVAFFPNHAKRFVAAGARHQIRKHARQYQPQIIWNTAIALGAHGAILEMLIFVRENFFFFTEEFYPRKPCP